jgi:hypothetical protein
MAVMPQSTQPRGKRETGESMRKFTDALRGYAYETMKRDGFKCRYCGLDGRESFDNWLTLSEDHLLPKSHPKRNDRDFIVCACNFCNCADNRYFDLASKRGLVFDSMTPEALVQQRRAFVLATRASYQEFWQDQVLNQPPA